MGQSNYLTLGKGKSNSRSPDLIDSRSSNSKTNLKLCSPALVYEEKKKSSPKSAAKDRKSRRKRASRSHRLSPQLVTPEPKSFARQNKTTHKLSPIDETT